MISAEGGGFNNRCPLETRQDVLPLVVTLAGKQSPSCVEW
jgi:hypothetical protein